MNVLLLLVLFTPTPGATQSGPGAQDIDVPAASFCEQLWFTRNLVFHRAGYCFGTPLGQAVFGNAGCVGKNVEPDPAERHIVDEARRLETLEGCAVDTTATSLAIPLIEVRKALPDIPVPDGFESSCIGWQGGAQPLYNARSTESHVLYFLAPGDTVNFSFQQVGPWTFVEAYRAGRVAGAGWTAHDFAEPDCEAWAG